MIHQNTISNVPFKLIKLSCLQHIVTNSEFKIKPESKVFNFKRNNTSVKILNDCTDSEKVKVMVKIILPHYMF